MVTAPLGQVPAQTVGLLQAARQLYQSLPADGVLLLAETEMDWEGVRSHLEGCRLLVAAVDSVLTERLKQLEGLVVLDIDHRPVPIRERLSLALLEAIATEKLHQGALVLALYNGVEIEDAPDQI